MDSISLFSSLTRKCTECRAGMIEDELQTVQNEKGKVGVAFSFGAKGNYNTKQNQWQSV